MRRQSAFTEPGQVLPNHQFQTKRGNSLLSNVRNCFLDRIGRENQIEIGAIDHPLTRHFLHHPEQITPVVGPHHYHRKIFDFASLDKSNCFKQFIKRSSATLHYNESVGVFYQQCFANEKVMERDAAIEKCVWLLLEFELDVATDRAAVDIFRPAIGRFHDSRSATSHDGESELRDARAHFTGQVITGMTFFNSRRTKDGHTWPNEVEHPKPAQKIQQNPQEGDQLIETRARSFQKNFISTLWRRSRG